MNKMAAATSQAGNGAGRRRSPPGHRSGQPRRPAPGELRGAESQAAEQALCRFTTTPLSPRACLLAVRPNPSQFQQRSGKRETS